MLLNQMLPKCYSNVISTNVTFCCLYLALGLSKKCSLLIGSKEKFSGVIFRSNHRGVLLKKCSYKFRPVQETFFDKVLGLRSLNLLKKTPTQVFSYEFWKIFKNTFFYRASSVTASVVC